MSPYSTMDELRTLGGRAAALLAAGLTAWNRHPAHAGAA